MPVPPTSFTRPRLKTAVINVVKWGGLVVALLFVPAALGAGGRQPVHTTEYWVSALACLALAAVAWRADAKYLRRARVGLCAGCGYDRAGLAAGSVCPECGAAPSVTPSAHAGGVSLRGIQTLRPPRGRGV